MKVLLAATPSLTEMKLCLECDHVDQRLVVTPVTVSDYSSEFIFLPIISQLCPLATIIKLWTRNATSTTTLEQVLWLITVYPNCSQQNDNLLITLFGIHCHSKQQLCDKPPAASNGSTQLVQNSSPSHIISLT
jgi:hypothetical protein